LPILGHDPGRAFNEGEQHATDKCTVKYRSPEQWIVPSIALNALESTMTGCTMKNTAILGVAAGLLALSACNSSPREEAADNIEANAESVADNLEEAADNATTEAAEDNLENQADVTREVGDAKAEDMRTHDADTNLANGL
jgi:hypothetical protein